MGSFIQQVLKDLQGQGFQFETLSFIVPNKRAALFLKKELSQLIHQPLFSPEIKDIEHFVTEISQLKLVGSTDLYFHFYKAYSNATPEADIEPLEMVLNWAPTLLQDFNEIDRHLVDADSIFNYLEAISDIKHWSLALPKTELIEAHLQFWNRLQLYYNSFQSYLLDQGLAYQGLAYRTAVNNLEAYLSNTSNKTHVFLGFNALNTSESHIIQELLQNDQALIYWDMDQTFFNNPIHSAGYFARQYKAQWPYFKKHAFKWIQDVYANQKHIEIIGVPKPVGEAKCVGQILESLETKDGSYSEVAVVLGEEALLLPVLNSIPETVRTLNITMGLPLKDCPLSSLFDQLFQLHQKPTQTHYFQEVLKLLSHPSLQAITDSKTIISAISAQNRTYISAQWIGSLAQNHREVLDLLFHPWDNDANTAISQCQRLILILKELLESQGASSTLELEYLYRFHQLFNTLKEYQSRFQYLSSIKVLYKIYKELLSTETLDFQGEPLMGLQIMGMLESRSLDFDTVIITSVNEGILPGGKGQNSFIPFDVKLNHQLPTYKEKDAIYTYHFYRLIQRAKRIYLIYNTEMDVLNGGEKSRFIHQLETEKLHAVYEHIQTPKVHFEPMPLQRIEKTKALLQRLQDLAFKGFSPSSLANYLRNPIDFYKDKLLGIKTSEEVEETIAANTFGTILHETLEALYLPFIGQDLKIENLQLPKADIEALVRSKFDTHYGKGHYQTGKNLIAFEVAQRYIHNFLKAEIATLRAGNRITLIALEHEARMDFSVPTLDFPMVLKGTVDRIDIFNGIPRIIDYKSGKVEQTDLNLSDWSLLATDYKKSKALQLLCYAFMLSESDLVSLPFTAGIFSFKNLSSGLLVLTDQTAHGNAQITAETLLRFKEQLDLLITEMFHPDLPFEEKELP